MVSSKEEILKAAVGDVQFKPYHFPWVNVENAMDKWAALQATYFLSWVQIKKYVLHSSGYYHNQQPEAGKKVFFTISELYNLFIQDQSK